MGEDFLLYLPRIDVRSARYVHVRGAAGDVDKTFFVHVAEVTGAKPAIAERFCVGFRIVIVAGENPGTDDADLAGLKRFQFASVIALDRDLHARALKATAPDTRLGAILHLVQIGPQHRDVAGDLAEPEILHQHLAKFLQGGLLVLAVHRRPRVDDVTQR